MADTAWAPVLVLLAILMLMTPVVTDAHGDNVCMVCPCGRERCDGNSLRCCFLFQTQQLAKLRVSVNCSRPGHSHIVDLVGLPYGLMRHSANCTGCLLYTSDAADDC